MTDAAPAEGPVASRTAADVVTRVVENLQRAVRAPRSTLELCVLCLIAEGRPIIDFPGVGKTVLAKSAARSLDLSFSRLQFVNVYNQLSAGFEFRPGPVFANVLLVDEIDRASPKTQSALPNAARAKRELRALTRNARRDLSLWVRLRGFASLRSVRGAAGA
jgi:MoxR-like ATPase